MTEKNEKNKFPPKKSRKKAARTKQPLSDFFSPPKKCLSPHGYFRYINNTWKLTRCPLPAVRRGVGGVESLEGCMDP
jgi:hypothetical protein